MAAKINWHRYGTKLLTVILRIGEADAEKSLSLKKATKARVCQLCAYH